MARSAARREEFPAKVGLGDVAASTKYYRVALPGDVGDIEWFWLVGLSEDGDGFSAKVSNPPDVIHNVSWAGQPIYFTKKNIGDWMYFQDGKIVGNVTACPALAHASAERDVQDAIWAGLRLGGLIAQSKRRPSRSRGPVRRCAAWRNNC